MHENVYGSQAALLKIKQFKNEPITILIIDDHDLWRQKLEKFAKKSFPNAEVTVLSPDEYLDVETIIIGTQWSVALLDNHLDNFKDHPKFGTSGTTIARYIKKASSNTVVIMISIDQSTNIGAVDMRYADLGVRKDNVYDIVAAIE